MSTQLTQHRTGGLTTTTLSQRLASDPAQARELGAYFSAQRDVRLETRSLGTFTVDGERNGILYDRRGTQDVPQRMANGPVMTAGSTYAISADGVIDKNGWWIGGDVSPTDRGEDGSTRLQVAVVKDGRVLEVLPFTPDADGQMRISPTVDGAQLGFLFSDGKLSDNSGHFRVHVEETAQREINTDIAITARDAAGVYEAGSQITQAFEAAPEAALLPPPEASLAAERGLLVDRDARQVSTTDGYTLAFDENRIDVWWPDDAEGPATRFEGREVIERDGTRWRAEDGNYVLPNGALLRLEYAGEQIARAEFAHGDSRVNVEGPGRGDGPVRIGPVEDDGYAWRQTQVEQNAAGRTYRMGGFNDGLDDQDVTWNAEMQGRDLGRVVDGHDGARGRLRTDGQAYHVDPNLKPPFGTEDWERMLRSEIEDQRSTLSGSLQQSGASRELADLFADYLLGSSGTYDRYAQALQASVGHREMMSDPALAQQWREQQMMQQLFGGLMPHFESYPQAMQALQGLYRELEAQSSMQRGYQQNMMQSYIPNADAARYAQQHGIPPELLIEQALMGNRNGANNPYDPTQRFDPRMDPRMRGRMANDQGAALLQQQFALTGDGGVMRDLGDVAKGAGVGLARANAARNAAAPRAAPVARAAGRTGAPLRAGQNIIEMVQNPRTGVWEVPRNPNPNALVPRQPLPRTARPALPAPATGNAVTRTLAQSGDDVVRGATTSAAGGSRALAAARAIGRPLVVVGLVADTIDISSSYARDTQRADGNYSETKRAVGRSAGGWTGAAAGAATGALIGSAVPVVGTAVGAVVGGVVGALGGSAVGDWLGGLF